VPYNRISDWLFDVNDGSNRPTVQPKFLDGFKNMKAAYRQQQVMIFSPIEIKAEIGTYTIFLSIEQKILCLEAAMVTTPMAIAAYTFTLFQDNLFEPM